jgi:hypothetical protein
MILTTHLYVVPRSRIVELYLHFPDTIILPVVLYGCETWSLTEGDCEQGAEEDIGTEEG